MATDELLRSDHDGVVTLTLNRPDDLNALTVEMFDALEEIVAEVGADQDRYRCVVLRGSGRSFCAGSDLVQLRDRLAKGLQTAEHSYHKADIVGSISALPQPVIGAVHGHCYTGGLELALACDIIYAADNTRFADTHAKIGARAAWGLPQRLARRVGPSAAKEMMFTSAPITLEHALRIGLVDRVVPADELLAAVDDLVANIVRNPAKSVNWLKYVVDEGARYPLDEALAWERTTRTATDKGKLRLDRAKS